MTSAIAKGIVMRGVAAAVPRQESRLTDDIVRFGEETISKITASTGIHARRLAPHDLRASDLCEAAARRLMKELNWEPDTVDLLIFLSQTPDFQLPATACGLQDRLGMGKHSAAFDVNLGCSSFAYGLWIASALLMSSPASRALVLVGDTLSHHVSRDERALWPLFGDAGTATALERNSDVERIMHFDLGTDGAGWKHLVLNRAELDPAQAKPTLVMDGPAVFSFTLREVPPMVKRLADGAGLTLDDIDVFIFHQANEFILRNLQRRLHIPDEKFVVDLGKWGNTSGATLPLAMVTSLANRLVKESMTVLLAGYGVGLSWSSVILSVDASLVIPPLVEVGSVEECRAT